MLASGMFLLALGFIQAATPSPLTTTATATKVAASPQTAGPDAGLANSPTPNDPKELLEIGRNVNGPEGAGVEPWHLKAKFEVFDNKGQSKGEGSFEEWWVSEKQYKLIYNSPGFSQVQYRTDHGLLRSGDTKWPNWPLSLLQHALSRPLPEKEDVQDWGQRKLERKFGPVKLTCTALSYKGGREVDDDSPSFCFEPTHPILRYSSTSQRANQTLFDGIGLFRGRYIAKNVRLQFLGKPALSIHIETLEPFDPFTQTDFAPPAEAIAVTPMRTQLSSLESGSLVLKTVPPQYPSAAKMQGVQGEVIMTVVIGENGRIQDIQPLAGPNELQQPAVDAVRQWLYKPYLVNGEPVEVETEVYVIFRLG